MTFLLLIVGLGGALGGGGKDLAVREFGRDLVVALLVGSEPPSDGIEEAAGAKSHKEDEDQKVRPHHFHYSRDCEALNSWPVNIFPVY